MNATRSSLRRRGAATATGKTRDGAELMRAYLGCWAFVLITAAGVLTLAGMAWLGLWIWGIV